MKIASALVFMLFGFVGCYQVATHMLKLSIAKVLIALCLLAGATGYISLVLIKKQNNKAGIGNSDNKVED